MRFSWRSFRLPNMRVKNPPNIVVDGEWNWQEGRLNARPPFRERGF
jgi:hypothetical protein